MRSSLFSAVGLALLTLFSAASPGAALPNDSALKARSGPSLVARAPGPSLAARAPGPSLAARAPVPSAGTKRHDARAPVPSSGFKKRSTLEQQPIASIGDISRHLCPSKMSVCPITHSPDASTSTPTTILEWIEDGFECVDFDADLTSCGGCGSFDAKYDCTTVPGALGVSCVAGGCRVDSCKSGYVPASDNKSCVAAQ
ncbi:hypothetical protein CERSUDRAFT_110777 [Gelatoporia subvermispora B]|uniref:Protein CPL1-like domain-containing protein n=1 Tax=Ceriporiopsis subvermispora (strain B) TaxID=914234 RepID=M2RCS4_CERS8|nr:hypothetical protein CERSUDRAFT_110777 [Gelatoporia subvermispora B]